MKWKNLGPYRRFVSYSSHVMQIAPNLENKQTKRMGAGDLVTRKILLVTSLQLIELSLSTTLRCRKCTTWTRRVYLPTEIKREDSIKKSSSMVFLVRRDRETATCCNFKECGPSDNDTSHFHRRQLCSTAVYYERNLFHSE